MAGGGRRQAMEIHNDRNASPVHPRPVASGGRARTPEDTGSHVHVPADADLIYGVSVN